MFNNQQQGNQGYNPNTPYRTGYSYVQKPLVPQVEEPYESRHIIADELGSVCMMQIGDFAKYGVDTITEHGHMIYIDNGADILAVGHLDTVVQEQFYKLSEKGSKFYSPQLDDRLGVHILLNVLPKHGLKYDILLCDGEETGKSTAQFFTQPEGKEYKWVFEIDRMGTDVALYQYMNQSDFTKALRAVGLQVVKGSFTDICYMGGIPVAKCNFACGYYNNHSREAWCNLKEVDLQIDRIIKFYEDNKDVKYDWVEEPVKFVQNSYVRTYSYHPQTQVGQNYLYDDWVIADTPNPASNNRHPMLDEIDRCPICNGNCNGLLTCDCCSMSKHNDLCIEYFGICEECAVAVFNVDAKSLHKVLNEDYTSLKVISEIYNALGL